MDIIFRLTNFNLQEDTANRELKNRRKKNFGDQVNAV